jgi:hypothetical protein
MANSEAGTIVFGAAETHPGEFGLRGFAKAGLDSLETSRLNRFLEQGSASICAIVGVSHSDNFSPLDSG